MDGILNILKPSHATSHDIVNLIRKRFHTKKVGHTGTLDPMAVGVLPICIGKATKVSQFLLDDMKKYRCEMVLGAKTDTQDRWGKVIATYDMNVSENDIMDVFNTFRGEINQVPPMYSALKHQGKKLYELAREGKEIHRDPRKVHIYELEIVQINGHTILFDVLCSKGTYVRTLCTDIGDMLNCGAYMSFLVRSQSGIFHLENTVTLEELAELPPEEIILNHLFPIDYPLSNLPKIEVKNESMKFLLNGNTLYPHNLHNTDSLVPDTQVRLYADNDFIALGKVKLKDQHLSVDIDRVFS
ncbi:MAG: tRNA pseudouridine(55) synthase TruB [Bacillota bacterium]